MLFFVKYAPRKLDDIAGNEESRMQIKRWILNWLRGKKGRPLLVHGPVGTGKTSVAYALKNELELDLIEMNASDLRSKDNVERVLANAASAESLSGRKKLILIDDIDALQKADSGGSSAILRILKANGCPMLLTAGDVWDRKLSGIRSECELVQFKRVGKPSIAKILKRIADSEKLRVSDELITSIAEAANGDVRSAINDLQANSMGQRDREKDVFDTVRRIFKATTYVEAKKAQAQTEVDYSLLKLWIDENIPAEYENREDLARAYNMLSRSDVFEGRIRKSEWGYLKYVIDLMTAGVALAKTEPYHKFVKYAFPVYLREMSATSAKRAMLKEIGRKIGARVHANRRDAIGYLHLVRHWAERDPEEVMNLYRLSEEELAFILETTVEDIRKNGKKKPKAGGKEEENEEEKEAKKHKKEAKEEKKDGKKEAGKEKVDDEKPKKAKKDDDPPPAAPKLPVKDEKKKNNGTLADFI